MSKWWAGVYTLAFLWLAAGAKASVRVQPIRDCSQRPRITVLREGKPAAGITIEVYRPVEHPNAAHYRDKLSGPLRTDSRGEVVLQKLTPGEIWVVARWTSDSITVPNLEANLYVRYFPEDPEPEDHFTMDLKPNPNGPQYLEQKARAAEGKPIAEHVEQFGGTVVDPTGAPIREISVEVAQLHVAGTRAVWKTRTDAEGHFRVPLPPGGYIALFAGPGFQENVEIFTIDPTARLTGMRVLLRVGAATE